ncbi:Na+/H+ antiporter subunit E [Anaplasma capra]|uniref:Na+/H+ antiporter subunit E n=1 Tax=Anaplasma capra TaxID=1562740 RepID=UPI0021D5A110|nr:Na+/H+ antiporter subunit E [Anaplasma capra]MCU7611340.1 Na+/H+ antiporter subunit E [Anaplasma capra]MCU7612414.1 Na+/H+ antiporter subunit E [Anaplasma capra]
MNIWGLYLIQMALWMVFSGHVGTFFLLSGAVSSLLSVFVFCKLLNRDEDARRAAMSVGDVSKLFSAAFRYLPWVFGQAVMSAWFVTKKILASNASGAITPVTEIVDTNQDSELGAFILASSITLTPGTVGMHVTQDYKIRVLALEPSLIPGVSEIDSRVRSILLGYAKK